MKRDFSQDFAPSGKYSVTEKQLKVLCLIARKNEDGSVLDLDQVLEKSATLGYYTSKAAIQFTIRSLIKGSFIAKLEEKQLRRGRTRVCFEATEKGRNFVPTDPQTLPFTLKNDSILDELESTLT